MSSPALVECRVPTCRRPELLARALGSLQAQTSPHWRAIVLDDSPGQEGRTVVAFLHDSRIQYRANPTNLGACGNINQAFRPQPWCGGTHAFVLEDDNAVAPTFIERGSALLASTGRPVMSFNQQCIDFSSDPTGVPRDLLRPADSPLITWHPPRALLHAFVGLSLPNGGYFWQLGTGIDFTVPTGIDEPQLQEALRQLQVGHPLPLSPEPLSLWSMLPASSIRRSLLVHRRFAASLNALSLTIARQFGLPALLASEAQCSDPLVKTRFASLLIDLSLLHRPCSPWFRRAPAAALKAWLRFHLYKPPISRELAAAISPAITASRAEAPPSA